MDTVKCCSCIRQVNVDTGYECGACTGTFHPKMCLGHLSNGSSYLPEDEYAYCKKCMLKDKNGDSHG